MAPDRPALDAALPDVLWPNYKARGPYAATRTGHWHDESRDHGQVGLLEDALAAHGEVWFCLDTRSTPNEEHALFAAFEQFTVRHGLRAHARAALGQPSLFVCHAWSPDRPPADRPGCRSPFE